MKLSFTILAAAVLGSASGFSVVPPTTALHRSTSHTTTTQRHMFGGAGAGVPSEDNPEEMAQMEDAAKSMGMSVEEYKLGINARQRLVAQLDAARVTGGDATKIGVERDGNNPPKYMNIVVTEEGKALGKEAVSKALVGALKEASDASRVTRTDAQKGMMGYIGEEMKKIGS